MSMLNFTYVWSKCWHDISHMKKVTYIYLESMVEEYI